MLLHRYRLLGLNDVNLPEDIPEPFDTFQENAMAKASFAFSKTGIPTFADDSGLEVMSLVGRPGVLSARYAGPQRNSTDNMQRVLDELRGISDRSARFITVIAYQAEAHQTHLFTGHVYGTIGLFPTSEGGFGYDPIFMPDGFDQSFAVLDAGLKNRISHRAKAMTAFLQFLGNL